MRFLEDEIIRLRAVEPDDTKQLWDIETDSDQWRENGMMAPYSMHNLREYAEHYDADPIRSGQLRLIMELKKEDSGEMSRQIAGIVDLYDISPTGRTAFVGIYVLKERRRRGLATRALHLTEEYCRLLLNLRMLGVKISGSNMPSRGLFEKSGFNKVGELKGWLLSGHETFPLLIYTKSL